METVQWSMSSIASVIQISVAPVFLLAGISALLAVMTNRLGRVIDRSRVLQRAVIKVSNSEKRKIIDREMAFLLQRGRLINSAITFVTSSALIVCLLIMALFLGSLVGANFSQIVAGLFVICMGLLSVGLILFLGEVFVATKAMRKGLADAESLIHND
jgi:hypothetical protein